jgi:pyruvate dehydrogenase E1 component alpha subunit
VTACFFGDGASNRGTFHEALNMAAIWKLPILFVCENNCYASTTRTSYACSVIDIASRAKGYDIPGVAVDGNDVLAVRQAATEAVARARRREGPTLLENKTYRRRGHFEGDPQKYRNQAEVAEWEQKNDPLLRFTTVLKKKKILTNELEKKIQEKAETELQEAVKFAEASESPKPEEALEDIFVNP